MRPGSWARCSPARAGPYSGGSETALVAYLMKDVINRIFSPTAEEIAEAREIVRLLDKEGIAEGRAAIPVNGKMIDTPMYWQAKRLLQWAEAAGISTKE